MSKPAPEAEEEAPKQKKTGASAVADLERRLAQLGGGEATAAAAPAFASPPTVTAPAAAPVGVATASSGKSALLVRIKSAERKPRPCAG